MAGAAAAAKNPLSARPVTLKLKRGSKTTKQRRRKAAKQAKAAAVGARRVVKHVKGKTKAGLRAAGK